MKCKFCDEDCEPGLTVCDDCCEEALAGLDEGASAPIDEDVTSSVDFGEVDDECLPLTRCVCGARFGRWAEVLNVYRDHPWTCPECGVKLFFRVSIRVYATA